MTQGPRLSGSRKAARFYEDAQPYGPHLRHLPREPSHRVRKSLRSHYVGAHSAHRCPAPAASQNLAQMVQSHALSFYTSPRLIYCSAWSRTHVARNIFGVAAARPDLGRA